MKSQYDYSYSQELQSHKGIRVEFTGKNLTKFSGIQHMRKFLRHLKEGIEGVVTIEKRESKFSVGEMLVRLLYAVILELKRQRDTLMLRLDRVFQRIAGVDDYPIQSTISRFLKRFRVETAKGIAQVNHSRILKARREFEGWHKITLGLDSHVRTAYGHQQRASVGYNPEKPSRRSFHPLYVAMSFGLTLGVSWWACSAAARSDSGSAPAVATVPGMPPVVDPTNLYSEASAGRLSPAVAGALQRVYVPNIQSNDVDVIDPVTLKVVDCFKVGRNPQHIVPSWDLKTLWVTNNAEGRTDGSLTPIDPKTGKPGPPIAVDDPYNMYFTPDGRSAIVVAETLNRLDFRNPHTMALQSSLATPRCAGVNHADFSIDGRYMIVTCEFGGGLVKIDLVKRSVLGYLKLSKGGMPQDIRISPDGRVFYVADMKADGVFMVDGDRFSEIGFIPAGVGTHGLYPSRDGKKLYVTNSGSNNIHGSPHGKGSVSVIDFATRKVDATWPIPGGGSPDMGNVSADGKQLWLSGRFDDVVYEIDTATGEVKSIHVGKEPHGLTVWPQPGRHSLGHTGNMR